MKASPLSKLDLYTLAAPLTALLGNVVFYNAAKLLNRGLPHIDMTSTLDLRIPFLPWTAIPYLSCFVFWFIGFVLIAAGDRETSDRLFSGHLAALVLCFALFLLVPTTNLRPAVHGSGFGAWVMRLVYAADTPGNLFPSIHCLTSWLCWVGVHKRRELPFPVRLGFFLVVLMTFVTVLTTRQHVLADVAAGVLVGELGRLIAAHTRLPRLYARLMDRLTRCCQAVLSR